MKNSLNQTSVTMMVFFLYHPMIINEMIKTALNFKIVEFTLFQWYPNLLLVAKLIDKSFTP